MPTVQPPSLGRVVHFVLPGSSPRRGEKRAAVVTGVSGLNANLNVQYDQRDDVAPDIQDVAGSGFIGRAWSVPFDPTGSYGTWQWPVAVAPVTIADPAPVEVKEVAPPAPITPASPEPTAVEGVTAQPTEDVAPAAVETPAVPAPAETAPTVEVAPSPVVEDVAAPAADEPTGLPLQSGDGVSTAETTPA